VCGIRVRFRHPGGSTHNIVLFGILGGSNPQPQGFLPPKPIGLQTRYVKNGAFIQISTYIFSCDVERYNHPLLGPSDLVEYSYVITPFLASQQVPASDP
jgi:hypothetical protein